MADAYGKLRLILSPGTYIVSPVKKLTGKKMPVHYFNAQSMTVCR